MKGLIYKASMRFTCLSTFTYVDKSIHVKRNTLCIFSPIFINVVYYLGVYDYFVVYYLGVYDYFVVYYLGVYDYFVVYYLGVYDYFVVYYLGVYDYFVVYYLEYMIILLFITWSI